MRPIAPPLMATLAQAVSTLPISLFALAAGVLADIVDRRWLLVLVPAFMVGRRRSARRRELLGRAPEKNPEVGNWRIERTQTLRSLFLIQGCVTQGYWKVCL